MRRNLYRYTQPYTCYKLVYTTQIITIICYTNRTYISSVFNKILYKYYVFGSIVRMHPSIHTRLNYSVRYVYNATKIVMDTCPHSLSHTLRNLYQCANSEDMLHIPIKFRSIVLQVTQKPPLPCTKCGLYHKSKFRVYLVVLHPELPYITRTLIVSTMYSNIELSFTQATNAKLYEQFSCPECAYHSLRLIHISYVKLITTETSERTCSKLINIHHISYVILSIYYIPNNCVELCQLTYVMNYLSNVYNISYVQLITTDTSEKTYSKLIYINYLYFVIPSKLLIIEYIFDKPYPQPRMNTNLYLRISNLLSSLYGELFLYSNTTKYHLISLPNLFHILFNLYTILIIIILSNFEAYFIPYCLEQAELFTFSPSISQTNAKGTTIYLTYISNG